MPAALSARLEAIAAFVVPGHPMADVGTDHALLPAALVARGTVPRAIASDVIAGPLEAAAKTLVRSGTSDRVELRLADGLQHLGDVEVATIVIAGMGGRSIASILGGVIPDTTRRLVLQPNTGVSILRRHLDRSGWRIVHEAMIAEAGRLYPIVVAERGGEPGTLGEVDLALGPILRSDPSDAMRAWVREQTSRCERNLAGLAQAEEPPLAEIERTRRQLQILATYRPSPL